VPWVIGLSPFLFSLTWRKGRWLGLGRPTFATLVALAVWALFVVYNFVGAMGSIASVRGQVIADRKGAADQIEALKYQRNRLKDQLGWIQQRRPAGQVAALIEAEKIKPYWESTDQCTDIRGPAHRRFCTGLSALRGELEAARKWDELVAKIETLNKQIEDHQPVAEKADPTAAILTSLFGLDERSTSERLPIATPIVLEIGSMTLLYFAFVLLGLNHTDLITRGVRAGSSTAGQPGEGEVAPPPPPARTGEAQVGTALAGQPSPPSRFTLTHQRELAEDFFRRCVRPAPDGQLTEADWYRHYCGVCERSGDVPLPVESFRRFAQRYVTVKEIGGTTYFLHVLPLIPKEDAA
jgi:hypothetical protein